MAPPIDDGSAHGRCPAVSLLVCVVPSEDGKARHKVSETNLKRLGDLKQGHDPRIVLAALKIANVVAMQASALRQLLLTEFLGFAVAANFPPQRLKVIVCTHTRNVASRKRSLYTSPLCISAPKRSCTQPCGSWISGPTQGEITAHTVG